MNGQNQPWLSWELELSTHLLKRMMDRGFSETDLRTMMDDAFACSKSHEPGRWILDTRLEGRLWQVVVEPDLSDKLLVVVTAYRLG